MINEVDYIREDRKETGTNDLASNNFPKYSIQKSIIIALAINLTVIDTHYNLSKTLTLDMKDLKEKARNMGHSMAQLFKENIKNGFFIQLVYLHDDIKNGCFKKNSPHYNRAKENFRLLYRKNLIIILALYGPLILIPIPWTAEIGIFLYYSLLKRLPKEVLDTLRLEFQEREDMSPEKIHSELRVWFKKKVDELKSWIHSLRKFWRIDKEVKPKTKKVIKKVIKKPKTKKEIIKVIKKPIVRNVRKKRNKHKKWNS